MGKAIYFSKEEIEELQWILPQFKNLHEDTWEEPESRVVNKIINKIDSQTN